MRGLLRRFKQSLRDGECVIGPFMKTCDPAFVEVAGYAGFDFAILDMEHGPISVKEMENNIRAAIISELVPIVRVPDSSETSIGKALDIGAMGTSTPDTECPAGGRVIQRAKFSPKGERGLCRFVRAANYSALDRYEY